MQPRAEKLLFDVFQALEEIKMIGAAFNGNFSNYKTNLTGKRAIERELEIIGEAVNKLQKEDPVLEISDTRKIIALRNYIIHSYDSVQDEMIWSILINNIPTLEKEIRSLLNK